MELNTNYWGTGDDVRISGDFRAIVSSDQEGSAKTIRELVQSTQIPFNEYIDESVFWCVSKMSEMSRYRFIWLTWDGSNHTWVVARQTGSLNPSKNSVHPLLLRDTSGFTEASKYEYGGYNSAKLAFGVTSASNAGVSEQVILRCARGKTITLAEVVYYDNCVYDTASSTYTYGSRHSIALYDFIHNTSLYGNPNVHVVGMTFYPYAGTSYTNRSYSNIEFTYLYPTHSPFDKEALNMTQDEIENFYMYSSLYGEVTMDFSSDYFSIVNSENYVIGSRFLLNVHANRYDSGYDIIYCIRGCSTEYWTFTKYSGGDYDEFAMRLTDHTKLMDIMHEFAFTGLFYTDKEDVATSGDLENLTDDHIFWGTIRHGYATGEVNHGGPNGKDAIKVTNPDLEESGKDPTADPDYDGEENTDTNRYVDETPLATPALTTVGVFNRSFGMTYTSVGLLADFLWNADETIFNEIAKGLALFGEEPMKGIIDLRLYPFDITNMVTSYAPQNIVIGRTDTGVRGLKLGNDTNAIIDLGYCTFFKYFKNFLDYSPYTEARLYLPYCGMIKVDTAEYMGHEISVKLVVDVVTGACTCMVFKDNILAATSHGVVGTSIPMSGTDSASYASAMLESVSSGAGELISSAASAGTSLIAGGKVKASKINNSWVGDAFKVAGTASVLVNSPAANTVAHQASTSDIENAWANYAGFNVPVQYQSAGSATPSCANWLPQYPYFIIDRPIPIIPDDYGHSVGYACCEKGTLSNYSGFTVCTNVDTSGFAQATQAERDELKILLENGIFL